jgi:hypothetical protein
MQYYYSANISLVLRYLIHGTYSLLIYPIYSESTITVSSPLLSTQHKSSTPQLRPHSSYFYMLSRYESVALATKQSKDTIQPTSHLLYISTTWHIVNFTSQKRYLQIHINHRLGLPFKSFLFSNHNKRNNLLLAASP